MGIFLARRALVVDHRRQDRARVRQAVLGELPGVEVEETDGVESATRLHEDRSFDLTLIRHPLPSGRGLPTLLKARWPERALLLYAPTENEGALADALESAGDAYFLESGDNLPGLKVALRLALSRTRLGAHATQQAESERRARGESETSLEQLRQGHRQLETLLRRLVELQETERRDLARELHDELGQIVAGLKLQLEDQGVETPEKVQSLLGELLRRIRDLSIDLRPPMLDELGLVPTLLWHFERYHARTGVRVDFLNHRPAGRFAPEVETAAFRILEEALTNVARHSRVQEASVSLEAHADRLELRVEDRGVGFQPGSEWTEGSGGLADIRGRARLLGGRLTVESAPGTGTRVVAELPLLPLERRGA